MYARLPTKRHRKYSPAIAEDLISPIYHAAKRAGVPMTVYVSRVLAAHLAREAAQQAAPLTGGTGAAFVAYARAGQKGER